jgi:hypothetical protein
MHLVAVQLQAHVDRAHVVRAQADVGVADLLVGQPAQARADGLVEAIVTQHGLRRRFAIEDRVAGGERGLQVLHGGAGRAAAVRRGRRRGHVAAFAALAALAGQEFGSRRGMSGRSPPLLVAVWQPPLLDGGLRRCRFGGGGQCAAVASAAGAAVAGRAAAGSAGVGIASTRPARPSGGHGASSVAGLVLVGAGSAGVWATGRRRFGAAALPACARSPVPGHCCPIAGSCVDGVGEVAVPRARGAARRPAAAG